MAVICFGAIPRGSSHHGIAHADEPPPRPPAFVSFSLPYEGNAVILQTCTEKLPVFVNQPTACSYFSARHRSASLRTVRLLLSLLPPLILFHPLRVVSTHAYSLKLTPTCTHSHVHSVFIFFRSVVELVIAAVSCLLLFQACIPSWSACLHQPYCLYRFFYFFLSSWSWYTWTSSSVGDFKITTQTSPTPPTEYTVPIPRLVSGSWDTSGGQSCSRHLCVLRAQRKWAFAGKQTREAVMGGCRRFQETSSSLTPSPAAGIKQINSKSGKMKIRQTKARGVVVHGSAGW